MYSKILEGRFKMISCTEFIPAYSEFFKYLDNKKGYSEVIRFWQFHSDNKISAVLGSHVARNGLAGCWEYWSKALTEEAADFHMEFDEDEGVFSIEMRGCPSKGRLLNEKHIEPYERYCEHCDVLYRRVLEKFGFEYDIDLSRCGQAKCRLVVKNNNSVR